MPVEALQLQESVHEAASSALHAALLLRTNQTQRARELLAEALNQGQAVRYPELFLYQTIANFCGSWSAAGGAVHVQADARSMQCEIDRLACHAGWPAGDCLDDDFPDWRESIGGDRVAVESDLSESGDHCGG